MSPGMSILDCLYTYHACTKCYFGSQPKW